MASPNNLDDKLYAFLAATVLYSDLPKDALPLILRRVEVAVKIHRQQDLAVSEQSIYDLASRIVMGAERKAAGGNRDALNSAVSLHRPLNGQTQTTFLDLQAIVDQEAQEEQFSDFTQALAYLSEQLPAREYSYLLQLLVRRPSLGGFNLLTERYAQENLAKIRQKLDLAMRLFPDVDSTARVYQLDMESALEQHVQEVYGGVLLGVREKFPREFFKTEDKRVKARILTRTMVEKVLKRDPLVEKIGIDNFRKNKLWGMLSLVYNCSSPTALEDVYGHVGKRWELTGCVGRRYWTKSEQSKERARFATRWLIEEKLKWNPTTGKKIAASDFYSNRLGPMLKRVYDSSPTEAVMDAYPGKYQPWEVGAVPRKYWTGENGREHSQAATHWLVEKKLQLPLSQAVRLTSRQFEENHLGGMLVQAYKGSSQSALLDAYPGKFKLKGRSMLMYIGDFS